MIGLILAPISIFALILIGVKINKILDMIENKIDKKINKTQILMESEE